MNDDKCTVCGKTGYWVGFDTVAGECRCINHYSPIPSDSGSES